MSISAHHEVEDFLKRVRRGEFEIDSTHPGAAAYQMALHTYTLHEMASALPSPDAGRDMMRAIDIAISQGATRPRREDLEKLSREIIDKKVTEEDIDRAEGDSRAKNYLKGLWNKFVDKSKDEIIEILLSAIRTHGLPLVLLLINLVSNL